MPKIFISYRREDSKHAVGRLHAALKGHVANAKRDIFIDIDNIPKGVDFVDHLDGKVAECDVMLAVIGPSWLTAADPLTHKRRLDDPGDFVRIEVGAALKRGIPVVPVVLDDTPIPPAEALPDDLKPLARRNGERLEHESFEADVARLIRGLPSTRRPPAVPAQQQPARPAPAKAGNGKAWLWPVVGAGAVAVLAVGSIAIDPFGWRSPVVPVVTAAAPPDATPPNAVDDRTKPPQSGSTAPPLDPAAPQASGPSASPSQPPSEPVFRIQPEDTAAPTTPANLPPGPRMVSSVKINSRFSISDVAFSPDGLRFVAGNDAGENVYNAGIWDTRTGSLVTTLSGHKHLIADVAWSPDGSQIVTGTLDDEARVWDAKSGQLLFVLSGPASHAIGLNYSPDGARFVTAAADRMASIRDAKSGALQVTLAGHADWVTSAVFSADGRRVLTASRDKTARIWDAASGRVLMTFSGGHSDQLLSASFSPDESRVVTTSYDNTVRFWDAASGEAQAQSSKEPHWVHWAVFTREGARVITSGGRVLDAKTAKVITSLPKALRFAAFSPDGAKVTTVDVDNYIRTWQLDK